MFTADRWRAGGLLELEGASLLPVSYARDVIVVPEKQDSITAKDMREFLILLVKHGVNLDISSPWQAAALAVMATDRYGRVFVCPRPFFLEALTELTGTSWTDAKFAQNIRQLWEMKKWKLEPVSKMVSLFNATFSGIYGDGILDDSSMLGRLRFDPKRSSFDLGLVQMLNGRVWEYERVDRLGPLLPPSDPDGWPEAVRQTVELIMDGKIGEPSLEFEPQELAVIHAILREFVATATAGGRLVRPELADFFQGEDLSEKSLVRSLLYPEHVIRYRYCVKLAMQVANENFSVGEEQLFPAQRFLSIMRSPQRDVYELIRWLSHQGKIEPPTWFRGRQGVSNGEKKKGRGGSSEEKVYDYVETLPRPDPKVVILYTNNPLDVPAEIRSQDLKTLRESGKFTEIPINDVGEFNRVMSRIFGNPKDHNNTGQRVEIAIRLLLSKDPESLQKVPWTNDMGMKQLRKIDAAQQRVGVYGQWSTDQGRPQVFVLVAKHKNERRTASRN